MGQFNVLDVIAMTAATYHLEYALSYEFNFYLCMNALVGLQGSTYTYA